jgi:hypothetical protein
MFIRPVKTIKYQIRASSMKLAQKHAKKSSFLIDPPRPVRDAPYFFDLMSPSINLFSFNPVSIASRKSLNKDRYK